MFNTPARRMTGTASLVAVVLSTTACVDIVAVDGVRYVDRQERRFSISGKPDLTLATFDGSIEIRSWDRAEVLVVVERRAATKEAAETIEIQTEQDGNRISLTAKTQPHQGWVFGGRGAKLTVSVPMASDVTARSGDGSLDVEGLSGRLDLRSGDGSIRGRLLSGNLTVHTGDGSIRLDEVTGRLDAHTGDGSVVVGGALSGVSVRTGDGSVVLRASGGSATTDDWSIVTGDGSVTLEIPEHFDGSLDAHTGDGGIAMHGVSLSNVTGPMGRDTVRGDLGGGGRPVRIRTGDGAITLRRQ